MKIKKKIPYLLLLLVMPILGVIYTILNEHPRTATQIPLPIDQEIPFITAFIIPYIIWYAFIFGYLVYFCFKDTDVYVKTLITIVVGELICFVIYFFFQTTVPRPTIQGNGFFEMLVKYIYAHDRPVNCFPSIHVLTTYAIMLASFHIKNKHKWNTYFIHVMGSLIILSTLFIKQHVILDMVASMFLVAFIYGTVFEIYRVRVAARV
ncbi:phosphatase PAP2 family protein [Bacillus sp. FJAT-45066]|uniref:phosphatase PAP2 family protein n=1 Tax=Bacillus sp. FJAT-45066 TaxID=2011010 RepID=UPI000BB71388|nr:phosphatase PAP2 family protein [Bacillus sp. FJAT-45066]